MAQGSILGLLLFNIFINDIFYFIQVYSDDNSLYSIEDNFKEVKIVFKNFELLQMCFFLERYGSKSWKMPLLNNKDIANESIELGNKTLHTEDKWEVLGIMC